MQKSANQGKGTAWTIIYVKNGTGIYQMDTSLHSLAKGDLIMIPPRVSYSFSAEELGDEYNDNMTTVVMRFYEAWLDDLIRVFPVMSGTILKIKEMMTPVAVSGPKWMRMASLLDGPADPSGSPSKIMAVLEELAADGGTSPIMDLTPEQEPGVSHKIEMIDRYLSCNICKKVTLEDVSSYVGMNRTYFCMFFRNHFKENFSDYINRKRTEKACSLLSQSGKDISAISSECGFKTVPYFTRVFTRITGMPPGKYRKSVR